MTTRTRLAGSAAVQYHVRFSRWRLWLDFIFVILGVLAGRVPQTYWALRMTFCKDAQLGYQPHSAGIAEDPLLNTFPCHGQESAKNGSSHRVWKSGFNLLWALQGQPTASKAWFAKRWLWLTFYVNTRHVFFTNGAFLLFSPGIMLLPFVQPGWWFGGGRTWWLGAWRVWTPLAFILQLGLRESKARVQTIDLIAPKQIGMGCVMARALIKAVPWPAQWRLLLTESALWILSGLLRHSFSPPRAFLIELLWGHLLGIALTLVISGTECLLLEALQQQEAREWVPLRASMLSLQQLLWTLCHGVFWLGCTACRLACTREALIVAGHALWFWWFIEGDLRASGLL